MPRTTIVLFNRDLRVHDHPALAAAVRESDRIVPLFVFDRRLLAGRMAAANRLAFLLEAIGDLRRSLRDRGGALFIRTGDVVAETLSVAKASGATRVFASADVSSYAQARQQALAEHCERARIELRLFGGTTIVEPGSILPSGGGDHFKVFTPYWRRWQATKLRSFERAPRLITVPRMARGSAPALSELTRRTTSPDRARGGERLGRSQMNGWLRRGISNYEHIHDDLSTQTSGLSAYLRFGCVSPLELAVRARALPGSEPFLRQLCWRDFFAQVTFARPELSQRDYRPRGDRWSRSVRLLDAWREGRTGYPIVDAAMRQLVREGYMHNRARLIVGSFLTKNLYIDWRCGANHFWELLTDGDIPNNACNWQWIAGTGNDSRPNRVLNPIAQAKRYDPRGDYVRRYLPELASIPDGRIHEPWKLAQPPADYPAPIVDHATAVKAFKAKRS